MLRRLVSEVCLKSTIFFNPARTTYVMKRKFELGHQSIVWRNGVYPRMSDRHHILEVDECTALDPEKKIIEVLLTDDVPGLGVRSQVVKVHRDRFWRHLHIVNAAELPIPERVQQLQEEEAGKPPRTLRGDAYSCLRRLEHILLYIPMNPKVQWSLKPVHVKSALRLNGFVVEESAIQLPSEKVTTDTQKQFYVGVTLNNLITAKVKCQIFLYNKVDVKRLQLPLPTTGEDLLLTDWLTPIEFGIGDVKPVK